MQSATLLQICWMDISIWIIQAQSVQPPKVCSFPFKYFFHELLSLLRGLEQNPLCLCSQAGRGDTLQSWNPFTSAGLRTLHHQAGQSAALFPLSHSRLNFAARTLLRFLPHLSFGWEQCFLVGGWRRFHFTPGGPSINTCSEIVKEQTLQEEPNSHIAAGWMIWNCSLNLAEGLWVSLSCSSLALGSSPAQPFLTVWKWAEQLD